MLQESLSALKEILHKIDPSAYELALENPEQKKSDKNIRITQPVEERLKLESKWKTFTINAKNKNSKFSTLKNLSSLAKISDFLPKSTKVQCLALVLESTNLPYIVQLSIFQMNYSKLVVRCFIRLPNRFPISDYFLAK